MTNNRYTIPHADTAPSPQTQQSIAAALSSPMRPTPLPLQMVDSLIPRTSPMYGSNTSTAPGMIRNIRLKKLVPHYPELTEPCTGPQPPLQDPSSQPSTLQAPSKRKRRGLVKGKKVTAQVDATGVRIPVKYDEELKKPDVYGSLVRAIGSWVRDFCPMIKSVYTEHPNTVTRMLYDALSATYDIPVEDERVHAYIYKSACERYKEWKSKIRTDWDEHGDDIRLEFVDRRDQWEWLVDHFNDEKSQAKNRRMKEARRSENKINHTSGCIPFSDRAKKLKEKDKCMHPYCATFVHVYKTNDPEGAAKVQAMAQEIADIYSASQVTEEGSTEPTTLPVETEINVIENVRPHRRGTTTSGLGGSVRRTSKPRGGAMTSSSTAKQTQAEQRAEAAERKAEEAQRRVTELERAKEEQMQINVEQSQAMSQQARAIQVLEEKHARMAKLLDTLLARKDPDVGSGAGSDI